MTNTLKHVAEGLRIAGGPIDDFAIEYASEVTVHRDVVIELSVGVYASDGFDVPSIRSASVGDRDIPDAVAGTGDDSGSGNSGFGDDNCTSEAHAA